MDDDLELTKSTWQTTHGDMTDSEWELIADLVAPVWVAGGRSEERRVGKECVP